MVSYLFIEVRFEIEFVGFGDNIVRQTSVPGFFSRRWWCYRGVRLCNGWLRNGRLGIGWFRGWLRNRYFAGMVGQEGAHAPDGGDHAGSHNGDKDNLEGREEMSPSLLLLRL